MTGTVQAHASAERPTLAIACMFRNSALYLVEWIEFHRLMGASHFYMCDHMSEDGGATLLEPYVASGLVTLTACDRVVHAKQFEEHVHVPYFNECIAGTRGRYEWLACLDSDEFIVPAREGEDVIDVLARYTNDALAALAVNWQCRGTSGIERIPQRRLLTECLVLKSYVDARVNTNVKMIVRPARVKSLTSPHSAEALKDMGTCADMRGRPMDGPFAESVVVDELRLDHYITGDAEYFERYKAPFYANYCGPGLVADRALARARTLDMCDIEDRIMDRWGIQLRTLKFGQPRVAVVVHAAYASEWDFYEPYLINVYRAGVAFDFYATVVNEPMALPIVPLLNAFGSRYGGVGNHVHVMTMPNNGLDGGGWVLAAAAMRERARIHGDYDMVLKVHTKSPRNFSPLWRVALLDAIAGTPERVAECVTAFVMDSHLGMLGAREWIREESPRRDVADMLGRLGLPPHPATDNAANRFVAGTMFWARYTPLVAPLDVHDADTLVAGFTYGPPAGSETEGHMIERVFGHLVSRAGLVLRGIDKPASTSTTGGQESRRAVFTSIRETLDKTLPGGARSSPESLVPREIPATAVAGIVSHVEEKSSTVPLASPSPPASPQGQTAAAGRKVVTLQKRKVTVPHPTTDLLCSGAVAIEAGYERVTRTKSDIWEHVPTLYEYARGCTHITECGVRTCVSTWPFLRALFHNAARAHGDGTAPRLVAVDAVWDNNINVVRSAAGKVGVSYEFRCCNDIETELEPTDLLFIDTWHIYGHLKRELATHHMKVSRYIILHDTTIDALLGESVRMQMDIAAQVAQSGYPEHEIRRGVWPAVVEFVDAHVDEWKIARRWANCNGLTVLERIAGPFA